MTPVELISVCAILGSLFFFLAAYVQRQIVNLHGELARLQCKIGNVEERVDAEAQRNLKTIQTFMGCLKDMHQLIRLRR